LSDGLTFKTAEARRFTAILKIYLRVFYLLFELSTSSQSDDLLVGKSCGLHIRHSPKLADLVPSIWYGSEGAGQGSAKQSLRAFTPFTFAPDIAGYDQMGCCKTRGLAKARSGQPGDSTLLPTDSIEFVEIGAVFSKAVLAIAWREPQDDSVWRQGSV
jgi:hypothetical protein